MPLGSCLTRQQKLTWIGWAFVLILSAFALRYFSQSFTRDVQIVDMPIATFVALYCAVAIVFVILIPVLIRGATGDSVGLLFLILLAGLMARLMLFGTPAILEDDYNRYLWDGAVTANGINPYQYSPQQIANGEVDNAMLYKLKTQSGEIFQRINYPEFSTVYPPAAQMVFALVYWISPFNLDALRLVLLIFEAGSVALILAILKHIQLSPLWVTLYWWNPLIIKEAGNSVHMEPLLMFPVLLACFLLLKGKTMLSSAALAVAAGVKVWPILLVIPIWRQLLSSPKRLIANGFVFGLVLAVMITPVLYAELNDHSGFGAFASQWQASSAAYLIAESIANWVWPYEWDAVVDVTKIARFLLVLTLLFFIGAVSFKSAANWAMVMKRMFLITAAIYLLSPSNTPWYFIWIAPFLCFFPVKGLMLAGALIPLHYLFFHFNVRGQGEIYHDLIIWLIWLPVWGLLITDKWKDFYYRRLEVRGS